MVKKKKKIIIIKYLVFYKTIDYKLLLL